MDSDLLIRRCNVCYTEGIPLHKIRFFECGHWCCTTCVANSKKNRDRNCGTCRRPMGKEIQIFLAADDLVDDQIPKRADVDLSIVESEAASLTMEPHESRALINELEDLKQKHSQLMVDFEAASNSLRTSNSERRTIHKLYNDLRARERQLKEELEEKAKILQGYVKDKKEHEKEKSQLVDEIQSYKKALTLEKKKSAVLAKSSKRSPAKDPDASLLVESPVRDAAKPASENTRKDSKKHIRKVLGESKVTKEDSPSLPVFKRRREA